MIIYLHVLQLFCDYFKFKLTFAEFLASKCNNVTEFKLTKCEQRWHMPASLFPQLSTGLFFFLIFLIFRLARREIPQDNLENHVFKMSVSTILGFGMTGWRGYKPIDLPGIVIWARIYFYCVRTIIPLGGHLWLQLGSTNI